MIKHLRHAYIDKQWWDRQILACQNRMWYAQSWVLDITAPNWEALVDEASGAIMPLPWRKRAIFKYLFQPYGTQQLGVFAPAYNDALGAAFIQAIPQEFKFSDIALNEAMRYMEVKGAKFTELSQQVVPLDRAYESLVENYSTGHKRNLRKTADGPPITNAIDAHEFRKLFVRTTAERFKSGSTADHDRMEAVIRKALELGQCDLLGIRKDGNLCAAACFLEWEGRAIFYKSAIDASGQELKGMFRIVDAYIAQNAGSGIILDFAGSNTPSVARFNSGFGAQGRIYLRLQRNDLPFPFKWFKK